MGKKVPLRELLETYLETDSFTETGRRHGMSTQAVQARITYHLDKKLGRSWHRLVYREKIEELLRALEDD